MSYILQPLPYSFDALEPYIDARTMEIHYTKHHQGYVNNLNDALKGHSDLEKLPLAELLKKANSLPENLKTSIINQGGGHYNHTFFWSIMKPNSEKEAQGSIKDAIHNMFGSLSAFQEKFSTAAKSVFGSGWAWLCVNKEGELTLMTTPNQYSPIMEGLIPVIGLDVWEHAYYLHYQNKRADYIQAWWHVLNWAHIEELYQEARTHL